MLTKVMKKRAAKTLPTVRPSAKYRPVFEDSLRVFIISLKGMFSAQTMMENSKQKSRAQLEEEDKREVVRYMDRYIPLGI